MPFSFIDIEQQKSRVIAGLFFFILFFYFLTALLVLVIFENSFLVAFLQERPAGPVWPPLSHVLGALGAALAMGLMHWSLSTSHLIPRLSLAIGALTIDPKDAYHQVFRNIVDEVSVAIGGRPLEPMVIPTLSLNAFALQDFAGRSVIGVTEGLLSKLSRAQIEAVVGHEAGHIVSGDCLSTTVTCALAEIYEGALTGLRKTLRNSRGRGGGPLVLLFLAVGFMNLMSSLMRAFISRQREYRADAIAVRLTRDPLSLAEALKLISLGWRGQGSSIEKLVSIFIINPMASDLDERRGAFADLFSTHPPMRSRLAILTDMAHLDEKTLEENLKNFKRVPPAAAIGSPIGAPTGLPPGPSKWFVFLDQFWQGPFAIDELKGIAGLKPDTWARPEGDERVKPAFEFEALRLFFQPAEEKAAPAGPSCPHCRTALQESSYEGVPVSGCGYCGGVLVDQKGISRILIRKDREFSADITRLAEMAIKERGKLASGLQQHAGKAAWVLDCPTCGQKMRKQYFVYSYPVEIDRCIGCSGTWFDRQELEVLQYIFENKERFFEDSAL